ncbi:phosphoribosyltransferase family protein [Metapseudomonas resinovorans]|uniref:phosphoribosyltransferase family protein n=1 Tax=Metapseudomonas resinovorans TaxID=53412 RepID=UPI00042A7780|nr:phosphoribosyltransferase family protein [Pseudomonas resinovorans]
MTDRICLYDAEEIDLVLAAMARQIVACYSGTPFAMVGILRRGDPLAGLLQAHFRALTDAPEPPFYPLKVKRYADDLTLLHPETSLTGNDELAALNLAELPLLVVDDVLYEGHSLLRTCAYLAQQGARRVHTAVLVDRCTSTQPVRADIVGIRLQAAPGDIVECHVPPYEADLRIELIRHGQTAKH